MNAEGGRSVLANEVLKAVSCQFGEPLKNMFFFDALHDGSGIVEDLAADARADLACRLTPAVNAAVEACC